MYLITAPGALAFQHGDESGSTPHLGHARPSSLPWHEDLNTRVKVAWVGEAIGETVHEIYDTTVGDSDWYEEEATNQKLRAANEQVLPARQTNTFIVQL